MTSLNRNAKTTIELLMEVVAPVVGSIVFAVVLKTWTPLPTWACLLIAIPIGTILAWILMLCVLYVWGAVGDAVWRSRGEPGDAREPPPN